MPESADRIRWVLETTVSVPALREWVEQAPARPAGPIRVVPAEGGSCCLVDSEGDDPPQWFQEMAGRIRAAGWAASMYED